MLQIDAINEKGTGWMGSISSTRSPMSIGTDDWRLVRQVFRPRAPVKSLRLSSVPEASTATRLNDTGPQPQNRVAGTIWWDDVNLTEPESTVGELQGRGVKIVKEMAATAGVHLEDLDLGDAGWGRMS